VALVIAVVFAVVVVGTTIASLGRYCLTSQGGDTRDLPSASDRPQEPPAPETSP
jgi:hypothetical protein